MNKVAPSSTSIIWLIVGLMLASSPHFLYQPIWVSFVFMLGIGWRCMNIWFNWPLPSKRHWILRLIQFGIGTAAIMAVLLSYGTTIGRDAGVAFMVMMLGLKVTEIQTQRDYYITVFLGYFVVITNFFFTQNIPMAALMFLVVIFMTACLITLNDQQHLIKARRILKLSSQMLLQSIPIMLILFVLFPRIAGPLWGLPQDAHQGTTGMDNKMELGKISELILSDEVAFRVQFESDIPPSSHRYWRGPVLIHTDGSTWTELDWNQQSPITPQFKFSGTEYRYALTLEPHNEHWLFALDMPNTMPQDINAHFSPDGQLRSDKPINQRMRYELSAQTQYAFNDENAVLLEQSLYLPSNSHPKTKALAQQWRQQYPDDEAFIDNVIKHFNQQNFYYTLTPPLSQGDAIDHFLFNSRRGFCEHYAASFTVLMRAAGIPARVVTGYQGGEFNPVSGDLVIRQRDAHAWTEVWLQDLGWIRVDPTSAVSPDRIELGINQIMPIGMRSPFFVANSDTLIELWQSINHNWDAVNSMWNLWVLSYGPERQKELLSRLGMNNPDWQQMGIWLLGLITLVFICLPLFLFYQRQHRAPVDHIYQQFCNKLKRIELEKLDSEGPQDFAIRATQYLPNSAEAISAITALYIDLKYGHKTTSVENFKQAVKQFKPEIQAK